MIATPRILSDVTRHKGDVLVSVLVLRARCSLIRAQTIVPEKQMGDFSLSFRHSVRGEVDVNDKGQPKSSGDENASTLGRFVPQPGNGNQNRLDLLK